LLSRDVECLAGVRFSWFCFEKFPRSRIGAMRGIFAMEILDTYCMIHKVKVDRQKNKKAPISQHAAYSPDVTGMRYNEY